MRNLLLLLIPIISSTVLFSSNSAGQEAATKRESRASLERGRELAQKYCSTCHLFPEPELLTKTAWIHHIQPDMAKWLGIERVDYEGMADGKILLEAKLYPTAPLLAENDWFAIWDYYRAVAPSQPLPQTIRPPARDELRQFRVKKLNPHNGVPMTSLVKIDPARKQLLVGDAIGGVLFTFNAGGDVIDRTRFDGGPVSAAFRGNDLYVATIGRVFPSDVQEGRVWKWSRAGSSNSQPQAIINSLRRPTDAVVARLNSDSRDDLIVCSFGNRLGRFSWFEGNEDGAFEEHVLIDRPGAIRAEVRDFNGDGRQDILVLMAQAREGLYLFLNQGDERFSLETIVEKPPTWGFAGFDVVDFNKDGRLDIVTANGDNGDFALPLKKDHGIRVYLNEGQNRFQETFFFPLHGAYKVVARDFDRDGDMDLATIAYYANFSEARPETFVYLENTGDLTFSASTCAESNAGRWMAMDAADLDGDGDVDLALGSFVRGPTTLPIPESFREHWRTNGAAVLLLENLVRR